MVAVGEERGGDEPSLVPILYVWVYIYIYILIADHVTYSQSRTWKVVM